jgi:hypothetical protein
MSIANDPICPEGCTSSMPILDFDACAPEIYFGEVRRIYVASLDADPFADWTDASEWVARIDNDDIASANAIRSLTVSADKPAAEYDEVEISDNRKVVTPSTHIINLTIDDISDANYEFMRFTECNPTLRLWFADDAHIYGGNLGVKANIMLKEVIERGNKSIKRIEGMAKWESKFSPERTENPLI